MGAARYRVVLAKEDFKFSAAHFTIFSRTQAERLHGHNYRVRVRVVGAETNELGLLFRLEPLKREIRRICARLDGKTLIPTGCSFLQLERSSGCVDVAFEGRRYRFPSEDTLLLPIANTTMEELALYLWQQLSPGLIGSRATELAVEVEETPGQSCLYCASVEEREQTGVAQTGVAQTGVSQTGGL